MNAPLLLALGRLALRVFVLGLFFAGWVAGRGSASAAEAATVLLCAEGRATVPVVIAPGAGEEMERLAGELADALRRISGAPFEVRRQAVPEGVVIGTGAEWPGRLPAGDIGRPASFQRDDYLLRTEAGTLFLLGRTDDGTRNALWDLLHHFGFRQFFPGKNWEIWPRASRLEIAVNRYESPAYVYREITLHDWPENRAAFGQWKERNRMASGFQLKTGHAYAGIISRQRRFFGEHPGAVTPGQKLDPGYPGVKEVVAADALAQLERHPDAVSLEPSDHGGWRSDSPLGSPSNQAMTLANHVAASVAERFPESRIGIYAYGEHAPAPDFPVHPNVIVSIATALTKGGYTTPELIAKWKARGAAIGIRDYLNVWAWKKDQPGTSRSTDLDYLFTTIPAYRKAGALFWRSETTPSWGVNGLGQYLVARLLWDPGEAERRDALLEDFYTRSFGQGAAAMRKFFEGAVLMSARAPLSQDLVGRMYRHLNTALKTASLEEERNRIRDLVIYTRYVELLLASRHARGAARQQTLEEMSHLAYRTRKGGMLSGRAMFVDFGKALSREAPLSSLAKDHPLKSDDPPPSPRELDDFVREGIAANTLLDFEPVSFSTDLLPGREQEVSESAAPIQINGKNRFYLYAQGKDFSFRFAARVVSRSPNRGPVKFYLHPVGDADGEPGVAMAQAPADKALHEVVLQAPLPGLYRLEVEARGNTELSWPPGQQLALPAGLDESTTFAEGVAKTLCFFVPEGTKTLGGYSADRSGRITDSRGETIYHFTSSPGPGYFSLPVPAEATGTWWRLADVKGAKLLMTVPPYLSRSPSEALLPSELMLSLP